MPETNEERRKVDAAPVAEKVKLPEAEAERRKRQLDNAAAEPHEKRSERRAAELKAHLDVHFENVASAHANHPVPNIPFLSMGIADQQRWNSRRHEIDMANKAYNRAVKATCAFHRDEDDHIARLAAAKTN